MVWINCVFEQKSENTEITKIKPVTIEKLGKVDFEGCVN